MYYVRGEVDPVVEMTLIEIEYLAGRMSDKEYDERMDELIAIANKE